MKVTKENINGVEHTVVWHVQRYSEAELTTWIKITPLNQGVVFFNMLTDRHIATALPPLPSNPTADDAELLYLYAAHGLYICAKRYDDCQKGRLTEYNWAAILHYLPNGAKPNKYLFDFEITYAVTKTGERVEIAITEHPS